MSRRFASVIVILLAIVPMVVFVFQNCSDVRLAKTPVLTMTSMTTEYKARVCPKIAPQEFADAKFLFVMDMSRSNIGGWDRRFDSAGRFLGAYWDDTLATDLAGDRFNAVDYFIQNCGHSATNRFSVIGFSQSAGLITTTPTPTGTSTQLECTGTFGDGAAAQGTVNSLRAHQASTIPWYKKWVNTPLISNNFPGIMLGFTSNSKALNCSKTMFLDDVFSQTVNNTQSYHIFFLSDGAPFDGSKVGCDLLAKADQPACYLQAIHEPARYLGQAAIAAQKKLHIYAVAYGAAEGNFSQYLDAIAEDGGTGSSVSLKDFASNPKALCDIVGSQLAIDYRPDFAQAINLTTVRRHGSLQADSDMDGITDNDERALGYDPLNPRSAVPGVLDGVCEIVGGRQACINKSSSVTCDATALNGLYLSDCDLKFLGLDKIGEPETRGIDTDGDGIPDFVEILKGTDPTRDDMNMDPDGDGLNNRYEVVKGLDPFAPDANVAASERALVVNRLLASDQSASSCSSGAWEMTLKQMPSAKISASTAQPVTALNHGVDEQVALLFYSLSASNSSATAPQFFSALARFRYENQVIHTDTTIENRGVLIPLTTNPIPAGNFTCVNNGGGC